MRPARYGLTAFACLATTSLVLVGCGSSGGTKAKADGGATGGTPVSALTIKGFEFKPGTATVKVGEKITWTNQDEFAHNIRSDTDGFKSDDIPKDGTYSFTFSKAGSYSYRCGIHPQMTATINAA